MKLIKLFLVTATLWTSLFFAIPVFAADATTQGLTETINEIPLYKTQHQETSIRNMLLDRVGGIVGLILSFVGVIFLILTVYAGIMWMTAQGNSGQVEKAKTLLINAIIGLVIISAAYSITTFVGQNLAK